MTAYDRIKKFFRNYNGSPATRGEIASHLSIPWSTVNRNIGKLCVEGYLTPNYWGTFVAYSRA